MPTKTEPKKIAYVREWRRTQIAFTRQSESLEHLLVVEFTHETSLDTKEKVLEALKNGLNKWMEKTKEGAQEWDCSGEEFNIGDLMTINEESYAPFLNEEGIGEIKLVYELNQDEIVSYDKVLASPDMTFRTFCDAMNYLAGKACERANRTKAGAPFAAVHHTFPDSMLETYFKEGKSPEETLKEIEEGSGV